MSRPVLLMSFTMIGTNICILFVVLYFIATEPKRTSVTSKTRSTLSISPFNLQRSLMAESLIRFYACLCFETWFLTVQSARLVLPVFFSAKFKTLYLVHSWRRASTVIFSVSIYAAQCFRILICVAPVVMYTVIIPAISLAVFLNASQCRLTMPCNPKSGYESSKPIILLTLIDLCLLTCFIFHIFKNTRVSKNEPIERKFVTISFFGNAANTICCGAFVAHIVQAEIVGIQTQFSTDQVMLDAITHVVLTVVLVALVVMKAGRHT